MFLSDDQQSDTLSRKTDKTKRLRDYVSRPSKLGVWPGAATSETAKQHKLTKDRDQHRERNGGGGGGGGQEREKGGGGQM